MVLSKLICGLQWAIVRQKSTNNRLDYELRWAILRRESTASRILLILLVCGLLSGCATLKDPEASQEFSGEVVARLEPGAAVSQTLQMRRPRFNTIQLWLRQTKPPANNDALITARLYRSPQDAHPFAITSIRFAKLATSFPVAFSFAPPPDPPGQVYKIILTVEDGQADLYGRSEDAYPPGALDINGEALPGDAAFRTSYEYDAAAVVEDFLRVLRGSRLVLPLLLVIWVPGRLLLWHYLRSARLDWGMRTALSTGMSLALIAVGMLWMTAFGLRWSSAGAWVVLGSLAAILAGLYLRRLIRGQRHLPDGLDLALAAVLIFSLALRLIMIRDLAAPPWVDSVHHATITRLIVEQGRYPDTYAPYVSAQTAAYHPGFHAGLALFIGMSGLGLSDAMLIFGQVQNALAVLAVYLLAVTLTRDRRTGVLAALAAGVFSPMPAYYISWGRYTQLAGLLILPVCIYLIGILLERERANRAWLFILAAVACAGTFLTHYRVAAFLAAWLLAYLIAETLRTLHRRVIWATLLRMVLRVALVALAAGLLALPWWPGLVDSLLEPAIAGSGLTAPQPLSIDWGYLTPVYGRQILWLALGGLMLSILRLGWFGPTLALWVCLLFMSANQGTLAIPLAGNVNKTSVEISLFMPVAVLAGYFVAALTGVLARALPRPLRLPYRLGIGAGFALLALAAAPRLLGLLNPATILARAADRPALQWMAANLPADAVVLTNPFLWGYGIYAGQDGGYWITPLTGRQSMPPPSLYGLGDVEQFNRIARIEQAVLNSGQDPQKLYELMQAQGIQYIYSGRRGGAISPQALSVSPLFEEIYNLDGARLFKTRSQFP